MEPESLDTGLIRSFGRSEGEGAAFAAVYQHLRRLAGSALRRGRTPTLQPTALVNEAWLKLRQHLKGVRDREHFLALAALAMRQILADHARSGRAAPRRATRVSVSVCLPENGSDDATPLDLIALDDALAKLTALKERHARVVELRFLCSLSIRETSAVLGVSHATVESDWRMAQAWLRNELDRG